MNATELNSELAQRLQLSKSEVSKRLDDMVAVITAELVRNNVVAVSNFGSLEVKKREERVSVHPLTGKRMLIPPKLIVKYKASSSLKDKIKGI